MSIIDTLVSRFSGKAAVTYKAPLSAHAFHIRIQSESFATADYVPGYFLRLFCGYGKNTALGDKLRSYSIWNLDRENRSADMAVCTHSDGPGTQWAGECAVGDTVYFSWQKGKFTADDSADHYLFVGDLSALAHLYELNRNLPPSKPRYGIVYAEKENDFFADINGQWPFQMQVLPPVPSPMLIRELEQRLPSLPGKGIIYIGGDSRVCVALNAHVKKQWGWETRRIKNKPFWNPEKRGLE